MPRWRNGRRCGLKIRFPQGSVGSNPALGTTFQIEIPVRGIGYLGIGLWGVYKSVYKFRLYTHEQLRVHKELI